MDKTEKIKWEIATLKNYNSHSKSYKILRNFNLGMLLLKPILLHQNKKYFAFVFKQDTTIVLSWILQFPHIIAVFIFMHPEKTYQQ